MNGLAQWAPVVLAHLVTSGLGPFYDGLLHFVRTPQDVLSVLALAFFAGLRGAPQGRAMLLVLPTAWFAGGVAGLALHPTMAAGASIASLLLCGLLVAADARLPALVTLPLAALVGLLHGLENGNAMPPPNGAAVLALSGIATAIFVVCALGAALVVSVRVAWMRIAVRVAGSWIAAIGLLLVGWSLRAGR